MLNKPITAYSFVVMGCVGALLSLSGFLGREFFLFELIASFKVHYLLALVCVLILSLFIRFHIATLVLLCAIGIHGYEVVKLYIPTNSDKATSGVTVRVMTTNLLLSNTDYRAQVEHVKRINPDLIVFQEYSHDWHQALSAELDDYPFIFSAAKNSPFGIALYSKYELTNPEEVDFSGSISLSLQANVDVDGAEFLFIGTHPVPPMNESLFHGRNIQMAKLGELAFQFPGSLVLAGDLNTVTWSVWFKDLLDKGNLIDTRRGVGILATWPSWLFSAGIPIDHIVVSDDIAVLGADAVRVPDSDHRSYWADLVIKP